MVKKWGPGVTFASIMDVYYQAVAWHHSQQIPTLVKERLMVLEGGGLVNFDIHGLLSSVMAQHIGQFRWVWTGGHRSWALLHQLSIFHVNFYPPQLFIDCENWLRTELGFQGFLKNTPLDSTIASYCRFLQRAQTLRINGMSDEALLHFVIALDLLLGLEGRSSDSVGLRASVLVHRQLGRTFDSQVGQIKKIYDRRSKYVHEGRPVSISDLEEAEKVCTQILWALLVTSASDSFDDVSNWLRQIDFLTSAIKASKLLPDSEFASVGIPAVGCTRIPPNRVVQSRFPG